MFLFTGIDSKKTGGFHSHGRIVTGFFELKMFSRNGFLYLHNGDFNRIDLHFLPVFKNI